MTSNPFWKLVRHEFLNFGNRRKMERKKIKGKWWAAYVAIMIIIGFVVFTIASGKQGFHLENIWYFSLGLPYVIFFMGHGLVKKEWDNETQGWWLTLPFSRQILVGTKFLGSLFQTWLILIGVYILAVIYAVYLTILQNAITTQELYEFLTVGFNWIFILVCVSPIVVSLGMTVGVIPYTIFRPIVPVLWFLFMFMGSFLYWGVGSFKENAKVFAEFAGQSHSEIFSYSLLTYGFVVVSWIVCFIVIRILGYLLNKKLSL
jgi:ABC-2 type transport system permease protein